MPKHILHIHGFNSSPQSFKAQQSKAFFAQYYPQLMFHCPQIANTPSAAIKQLTELIDRYPNEQWYLIGSSLGGYFSSYLAERFNLKAALVNPAVKPYQLLSDYVGVQINPYTQEKFEVTTDFIDDLKQLEQFKIKEKNYLVMVQTHDEVLNYQDAVEKYQNCQLIVQQGGDHSFVNFEKMLPTIVKFFDLP
ncbi:esterase YqiA [Thalassotalea sp. LPB0316]|uniref:YqiA/YcfP family alpha/beta fold hydrolase n=1 Tax=Thalassotalea sp. LPB0316 TaxID=2769490 RepID=UPI001866F5AD|nr:YqiA/YcfP family alpha/beta fold hydrolase [Thalassotalea sp. LPB0316]QOL26816.1 esterase YqiA [Thalassotalea sp. LPB0316]